MERHGTIEFIYRMYKIKLKFWFEMKEKMNNEFIVYKELEIYKTTFETIEEQINEIKSKIESIELSQRLFDLATGMKKNDKRN